MDLLESKFKVDLSWRNYTVAIRSKVLFLISPNVFHNILLQREQESVTRFLFPFFLPFSLDILFNIC